MPYIAYDTTDPDDALSLLDGSRLPHGTEPGPALAGLIDRALAGRRGSLDWDPTNAQEALAALTLVRALRSWAEEVEPHLVDIARAGDATWAQVAPHVGVSDPDAAQRRREGQVAHELGVNRPD